MERTKAVKNSFVKRMINLTKKLKTKTPSPERKEELCSELEEASSRRQPCAFPSSDLSSQQKAATLPCMTSCSLYAICTDEDSDCATFMRPNVSILSSDSGLGTASEDEEEFSDVFSDSEDEGIQSMVEDDSWWIDGSKISLRKVLNSTSCETVYSGYWHGNVEVHARRSSDSELRAGVIADVNMLTSIRHENIQLFLGVCDNLHIDYVSIVMDEMKGNSLHSLIHKQGKQFSHPSVLKIATQIAQGVEYLHAKGISHPMLSSKSITLHYRVCISMLSHYEASSGCIESDDLPYLPPEAIRTVALPTSKIERTKKASSVSLVADPECTVTPEANVFSFGTLVYEMVAMEKPYSGTPAATLISLVGSNDRALPLSGLPNGKYKQLARKCWRNHPAERPTFKELLRTLENTTPPKLLRLKYSSQLSFSEPSKLNKLGL